MTDLGYEDSLLGRNDEHSLFTFTADNLVGIDTDSHELEAVKGDTAGCDQQNTHTQSR